MLALVAEGAGGGPSLNDNVMGLVESLPVVHRVGIGGDAFLADAAGEAADHPAAGPEIVVASFSGLVLRVRGVPHLPKEQHFPFQV